MQFRSLIINMLLVSLIIVAMFAFGSQLAVENSLNSSIASKAEMKALNESLSEQLYSSQNNATAQQEGLIAESKNPIFTALGFFFKSILNAGSVFIGMSVALINTIFTTVQDSLGINPIVFATISAILVITLVLTAWRVYRSGE